MESHLSINCCPVCKSDGVLVRFDNKEKTYFVACVTGNCIEMTKDFKDLSEAIIIWNKLGLVDLKGDGKS